MCAFSLARPSSIEYGYISFDDLVGAGEQRGRHLEAERLRSLEVDHQLVLHRRLHRQIGRFLALEDAIDIPRGSSWITPAAEAFPERWRNIAKD